MSRRGRGTPTVRRSDNPFFQTTTGDIGQDFTKEVEHAAPTAERAPPRRTLVDNYDFGFLYEKMSDDIGAGQHHAPLDPAGHGRAGHARAAHAAEDDGRAGPAATTPRPRAGRARDASSASRDLQARPEEGARDA